MSVNGSGFGLQLCFASSVQLETWQFHNLSAPYWRWYWNDAPGWCLHFQGQLFELLPDRILLIPPNTAFSTSSAQNPYHHYIEFTLGGSFLPIQAQILSIQLIDFGCERIAPIIQHIHSGQLADEIQLQQHLIHSLSFFSAQFEQHLQLPPALSKVLHFLRNHLNQRFESAFLASVAEMNIDLFPRFFRKHMGEGLQEWHMRQRIEAICAELHHGELSMDQLADQFGFSDRYHMSKLFKKFRGLGPASFRRQRYSQSSPQP